MWCRQHIYTTLVLASRNDKSTQVLITTAYLRLQGTDLFSRLETYHWHKFLTCLQVPYCAGSAISPFIAISITLFSLAICMAQFCIFFMTHAFLYKIYSTTYSVQGMRCICWTLQSATEWQLADGRLSCCWGRERLLVPWTMQSINHAFQSAKLWTHKTSKHTTA